MPGVYGSSYIISSKMRIVRYNVSDSAAEPVAAMTVGLQLIYHSNTSLTRLHTQDIFNNHLRKQLTS